MDLPESVILMSPARVEEVARVLHRVLFDFPITHDKWQHIKGNYCEDVMDLLGRLQERGLFLVESAHQTKHYQKGAHD